MTRPVPRLTCLVIVALAIPIPASSQSRNSPMTGMTGHAHGAPSSSLTLTIDGKSRTLALADLRAMPQKTVTVHNEHTKEEETYSGVPVGDLLSAFGFSVDKTTHQRMLRSYVIAEGTDKYWVLYSATEVEASEHNADVIVAISVDGNPLGEDGQLKLISTGDKKPQRWVRNLTLSTLKSVE